MYNNMNMFMGYNIHRNTERNLPDDNDEIINFIKENNVTKLASKLKNIKNIATPQYVTSVNEPSESFNDFKNDILTLLHVAAFYDSLECFCLLEPSFHGLQITSTKSYYPIHYACYNGSREVVAYILSKDSSEASMTLQNIDHQLLYYAVFGGDPVIIEELFKNGADLSSTLNKKDELIRRAIELHKTECLKILLSHEKKGTLSSNYTPAMLAAKNCHPDALELLVSSADDLTSWSLSNFSAISLIFYYGDGRNFTKVLIKLLRKFVNIRIEPPNEVRCAGVCHWICKICNDEITNLMLNTEGYDINRCDENYRLGPYCLSVQSDSLADDQIIRTLTALISNGFDINYRPKDDVKNTFEYFYDDIIIRYNVVSFLIDQGADLSLHTYRDPQKTIYEKGINSNDKKLKDIFSKYSHQ